RASALAPERTGLRPRRGGDTYRTEWNAALASHPDWVLLENWNDYSLGGEIAPSLENGYTLSDYTHIATRRFAGAEPFLAHFLWTDAPAQLSAGSATTLHLRVQNAGMEGWGKGGFGQTPAVFTYRWKRGGQTVAEGAPLEVTDPVLSGQNFTLSLPVKTAAANGKVLPEGDYTLEVVLVPNAKKPAAGSEEERKLELPIKIVAAGPMGTAQWAATLLSTDLPQMLETGSVYPVSATLRNDGTTVWRKAEGGRVTVRLYRVSAAGGAEEAPAETPVDAADATADLDRDVLPGETVTVHLLLPLTDPKGKALPVWNSEQNWVYEARWEVAADSAPHTVTTGLNAGKAAFGVSIAPTPLAVVALDFGARIVEDNTPLSLPGERRQPVTINLKNVGAQTWKKEVVRVGYHWYYEDGTEFLWEDETTPLKQDVPPGGSVNNMLVWVTAPPNDGTYYLVWDVKFGDMWASTSASTRVYDERVHTVRVVRGRLTFADLTKAYTLDGITDTDDWIDGNFDGQGRTFPAALIPPYTDTPATPLGLFQASSKSGPESPRRISFRWGPKFPKANNFIVCKGQRLELGKSSGKCRVLHIIAASTGKEISTNLRLIFQEPTSQSEDLYAFSVSPWDGAPAYKEEIAFQTPFHHERSGVLPGAVKLYHYTITIREPRQLVAILLPNAPDIKIAAITLER
ncbi:MAG TPA: hypothetical protein VKU00_33000, partial [Chthonomonadaceae bacterium]|nr:hypothetical protein [Chthonomonadaceae bacterium]